ncbi:MAG: transposase [Bacteroidetes bacterium]|nr:transposase [Bacteroidota bacterium]MBL6944359.1 transposase [Bacteroidales bacterium]
MEPLLPNNYYHIYNHANGNDLIFKEAKNYNYFWVRYKNFISPIADTLVYCLMPNHFHLLIRIKNENEIINSMKGKAAINRYCSSESLLEKEKVISLYASKQFANLFSSYSQAFNKMYGRMGSLFMKNFKRKQVGDENYLKDLILYIHLNPIKHNFVKKPDDWIYSSYYSILYDESTFIKRNDVIDLFGDVDNFKFCHFNDL